MGWQGSIERGFLAPPMASPRYLDWFAPGCPKVPGPYRNATGRAPMSGPAVGKRGVATGAEALPWQRQEYVMNVPPWLSVIALKLPPADRPVSLISIVPEPVATASVPELDAP